MVKQKPVPSFFNAFGEICAALCVGQLILFAFISVWVALMHTLPFGMALLWFLGIPISAIAAPASFLWSVAAFTREELVKGLVAFLSAVITPIWLMYGMVNAAGAP